MIPAIFTPYFQVQTLTPQSGAPVIVSSPAGVGESTSVLPFGLSLTHLLIIGGICLVGCLVITYAFVQSIRKVAFLAGALVMTSAVPLSVFIMNGQTRITSHAGPAYTPKSVQVSHVTSTGFSVQWETDQALVGVVRVRELGASANFNRIFSEPESGDVYKHVVHIAGVKPSTNYAVEVLSGGVWYDDHGRPVEVRTPAF